MMALEKKWPVWMTAVSKGKVEIDAERFYPEILDELLSDEYWPKDQEGIFKDLQRDEVDQYWLEVAFQCAKMDVQSLASDTDLMPEKGGALVILVKDGSKKKTGVSSWAQKNHKVGRGIKAATTGKEAREHYKRIRNIIQF